MASGGPEWLSGARDHQAACLELSSFRSEALRRVMGGTVVSPARSLASASLGGWAPFPVLTHHSEQGKQGYPGKHREGRRKGTASSISPLEASCFTSQEHRWGSWMGVELLP